MQPQHPPRREYDVTFHSGSLGLSLQPQFIPNLDSSSSLPSNFPLVVVMRCVPNQQAEASGQISPGDLLTKINSRPLHFFSNYDDVIDSLRNQLTLSGQEFTLSFSSSQRLTPAERMKEATISRSHALERALHRTPQIQLEEIREFAKTASTKTGVVTERLRPLLWKVLLGVLSVDTNSWPNTDRTHALEYSAYCQDMFPESKFHSLALTEEDDDDDYHMVDDILNEDIVKDIHRTHPGFHFFAKESTLRMMHRILYVYGRLNPGVSYVQGMNEILAPILFVFGAHVTSNLALCESDAFFCFSALMSDVRDLFIKSLDGEQSGLHGTMRTFNSVLERVDSEVFHHFETVGLLTQFFAVRPLTTLLTREFELPEVFQLWDALLGRSSGQRYPFVMYCLVAMVTLQRIFLLENDFATCLKFLQAPCTLSVGLVVVEAERIANLEMLSSSSVYKQQQQSSSRIKMESLAMDLFRSIGKAAKNAVEEAKNAVEEAKVAMQELQHMNNSNKSLPAKETSE